MALRLRKDDDDEILAQINIIPLVDVSLVLLIIFIATVNHILTPSIKINLPQSTKATTITDIGSVNIFISSEGVIYLEDKIVTLKELESQILSIHKKSPEKSVVINVDKSTYFQRVVDCLDILNGIGIEKLDLRTIKNNS
jgi:biopolymer transport protein ExbD